LTARLKRFLPLICSIWLLVACVSSCVRLPRRTASAAGQNAPPPAATVRAEPASDTFINLNTATPDELEKLPGVGDALAARIIEHRERYGRFRRVEHLLLVRGISERRFRAISAYLTVE
jgi:competence ComEA-like helix-hairpin-helix protein